MGGGVQGGGTGRLKPRPHHMNPACHPQGGPESVCPLVCVINILSNLWETFKGILSLFSLNSGMEKCVCKLVSPEPLLVASYKQGAGQDSACYTFPTPHESCQILGNDGKEVYTETHTPHASGIRGTQFNAQFNPTCQKINDLLVVPAI